MSQAMAATTGSQQSLLSMMDEGFTLQVIGYRPSLLNARGKNWAAVWADGTTHKFKASPQATKKLMADIALRWDNPPDKLHPPSGRPFNLSDLIEESPSHVDLVQLLTFDETADGRAYFKIGKAVSIPKRIKQFGPCRLVDEVQLTSEKRSLCVEAELHVRFNHLRRPETEIFCMGVEDLAVVRSAFSAYRGESH